MDPVKVIIDEITECITGGKLTNMEDFELAFYDACHIIVGKDREIKKLRSKIKNLSTP